VKSFSKIVGAALGALALVSAAPAFAANLITNGDFSTPDVNGGWGIFSQAQSGWSNATDVGVEIGRSGYGLGCYTASCQNLEVNANTFGDVSQTVTGLTVGRTYDLTFAYGGRPDGGPQSLQVMVNGTILDTLSGSVGVWTPETYNFTANQAAETIEFKSLNVGGLASYGNEITGVTLAAAAPEPGAWALMIMGLGMVGAALRRRQGGPVVAA
jgi:hypothetical protein